VVGREDTVLSLTTVPRLLSLISGSDAGRLVETVVEFAGLMYLSGELASSLALPTH
jgi:hypothetical protein